MTYKKRFNRSASQLMMAALALAIALIPIVALAQGQQEKGRRVTPNSQDSAQAEAQADQSASSAQDKLILIETQETGFFNPILDTRTIRIDVSEISDQEVDRRRGWDKLRSVPLLPEELKEEKRNGKRRE